MKKELKFNIVVFFTCFILFILIWLKLCGFIEILPSYSYYVAEYGEAGYEIRASLLRSTFNPYISQLLVMQFINFFTILLVFIVTMHHIYLKKRYYVYLVGRKQNFFKTYFKDGLKKVVTSTMALHLAFIIFLSICFYIYGSWDGYDDVLEIANYQNIGFINYIFVNSPATVYFVVYWIPIYIFMIINYCFIILLNELFKNTFIVFGILISFLFLGSFILSSFGLGHLSLLALTFTSVNVYVPYQYSLNSATLSLLLVALLSVYRKVYKIDEI